jgi:hypothetical protein
MSWHDRLGLFKPMSREEAPYRRHNESITETLRPRSSPRARRPSVGKADAGSTEPEGQPDSSGDGSA